MVPIDRSVPSVEGPFKGSVDGAMVSVGVDAWQLVIDSAQLAQDRLWVQLTAYGTSVWILTLRLPPVADDASLLAVVTRFLRQPDADHVEIVNALKPPRDMMADRHTIIH